MALNLERSGPWIGIGGLVCVLWLYIIAFLMIPWWAALLLLLVWVLILGYAIRRVRTHPRALVALPLVAAAAWLAGILAAELWL